MAKRRVYKMSKEDRDVIRERMYSYWDRLYHLDTESKIAQAFLQNLDDPESIFNDIDFLQKFLDDAESEKRVKNTRRIVDK